MTYAAEDIVNDAIDMLQGKPIASLDDNTNTARLYNRVFQTARDAFLEMHNWNFATKRVELPEDSLKPQNGWSRRYLLPGDCLRLMPVRYKDEHEGDLLDYVVEGRYILTDESAPLRIRYIYRNQDYGSWPATARKAMSAKLAMETAHSLTKKASFVQLAEAMYAKYMMEAKRVDGLQGTAERPSSQTVINVRQNDGYYSGRRNNRFRVNFE